MNWDTFLKSLANTAFILFLAGMFCSMFRAIHDLAILGLLLSVLLFFLYAVLLLIKKGVEKRKS